MIKLPDTPAERIATGSTVPLPALKVALERLVGQGGLPMLVELDEARPAGFLKEPVECLVVSHATDRKNYEQVVLTQASGAVSARLMVYYVGKNKYTRAMRVGAAAQHHSLTNDVISGVTRMLNAGKAQQQEMYFEDLGFILGEAIEMVASGAVRASDAAARPAPTPAPASRPEPRPAPAPQPAPTPRPEPVPRQPQASPQPRAQQPAEAPAARPRPSQPQSAPQPQQPTYRTVPMSEYDGVKVRTTCTCPNCGAQLHVSVPNASCLVNITCTTCHRKFPMEVRPRA